MNIFELLVPIFSQMLGYVDSSPSGIQTIAQSGVSASYVLFTAMSQKKTKSLETYIKYNIELIEMKLFQKIDYPYINSDAFMTNFLQSTRAAEIAESDEKIKLIARAFAGCTLHSDSNKALHMRIIDQITMDEANLLKEICKRFNNLSAENKFVDEVTLNSIPKNRIPAACRGLFQLGLLEDEKINLEIDDPQNQRWWLPSILAQEVMSLLNSIPVDMP